ncbi:carbamoyltransferase [Roseivirga sp.]|uniref:carbamoyltransferase family protein n=1 Tax=Roseivirga sp. TaxID=1964215 RepID=UPI003B8D0E4A
MSKTASYILGISAFYHDSAACLIHNGEIISAAQEERFTRVKHDSAFPSNAVKFCLMQAQITLDDVASIAFYEKPLLKFERVLENFLAIAPRGLRGFIKYMPAWLKEKVFFRKLLDDALKKLDLGGIKHLKVQFCEHHLSHAAWAYYTSPFKESGVLTIDGVGEWTTTAIYHAKEGEIKVLKEQSYPHSLGLLYSAFTQFLGFKVNDGEYKMMGLAPYGNRNSERFNDFYHSIKRDLITQYKDGSVHLNLSYFKFLEGKQMINDKKWAALFKMERRGWEQELEQAHCDFALAVQTITEESVLLLAEETKRLTGSANLCIAGGVGYNCSANGKVVQAKLFENLHVPPAVGDAGSAVGAGLLVHAFQNNEFHKTQKEQKNDISFLGPEFSDQEIRAYLKSQSQEFKVSIDFATVCQETSQLLSDGLVVGWMQGRMEFGARALGARSILGDPRNPDIQRVINQKIKFRESFRPFAVIILEEDLKDYYDLDMNSPYMAIICDILPAFRKEKPATYESLSIREKCDWINSDFPGITHVDDSTRIQTVDQKTNPKLHQLLTVFKKFTGCPMLINTSFNIKDQPIVCSPKEAFECFQNTNMDALVMSNTIIYKKGKDE